MAENKDSNIEYFNITMRGGTNPEQLIPAVFKSNRTTPILYDPSEWVAGLVRLYVPGLYIPIFKWTDDITPDGRDPAMKLYFTFNGVVVEKAVKFINQTNDPKPWLEGLVWNVTDFIDMVNDTIQEAFDEIKVEVGFPTQISPQFVFDANTRIISLLSDVQMNSKTSGVKFAMATALYSYFPCFPVREDSQLFFPNYIYYFEIKDNYINNITYKGQPGYNVLGEYPVVSLWNGVDRLLFASNTLPLNTEAVGGTTNIQERIIFDFVLDNSQLNDRTGISYSNQGGQRYTTMLSSFPMKKTDIEVLVKFKDDTVMPLYLNSIDECNLKIQFLRKNVISH